jgi:hypothetical protein
MGKNIGDCRQTPRESRHIENTQPSQTPLNMSFETVLALLRGVSNFYAIDEKAGKNQDSDREAKQT